MEVRIILIKVFSKNTKDYFFETYKAHQDTVDIT